MSAGRSTRRSLLVAALLVAGGALAFIAFGNIGQNLVYYWDPTQLRQHADQAVGATVRLGGLVKPGSLNWNKKDAVIDFVVTDGKNEVPVHATGAPPQMFREGIGVVVEGTMTSAGVFESNRLMVKHSNEYRVPKPGEDPMEVYRTTEGLDMSELSAASGREGGAVKAGVR